MNNPGDYIKELKKLTGRLVGVNLEAIDLNNYENYRNIIPLGRVATVENARIAKEMGANFIVLTGNPNTGVNYDSIINCVKKIKEKVDIVIFAGKMHSCGISESLDSRYIKELTKSGCEIVIVPAPGTVPGMTVEVVKKIIDEIHKYNALAMTTIGTSQEGADENTIRNIAIMAKMAGADIHHLGDCGLAGVTIPENIMAYSIAIRGRRHTYFRMAASINR